MPDDPCKPIQDELDNLEQELQQEIQSLSDLLQGASGPEKADILKKIRDLSKLKEPKISEVSLALAKCKQANPDPTALWATLTGTATLRTDNQNSLGPFFVHVSFVLIFQGNGVAVANFPPVQFTFNTPVGSNTTTITLRGSVVGPYDKSSGSMLVPILLRFEHSLLGVEGSNLDFTPGLTTGAAAKVGPFNPVGAPLNRGTSQVTLAGAAMFSGGYLNGTSTSLIVTGTLVPLPP